MNHKKEVLLNESQKSSLTKWITKKSCVGSLEVVYPMCLVL